MTTMQSKRKKDSIKTNLLNFIFDEIQEKLDAKFFTKINAIDIRLFISKNSSYQVEKENERNSIKENKTIKEIHNFSQNKGIGALKISSNNLSGKKIHLFSQQFELQKNLPIETNSYCFFSICQSNINSKENLSLNKNESYSSLDTNCKGSNITTDEINKSSSSVCDYGNKEKIFSIVKKNLGLEINYFNFNKIPKKLSFNKSKVIDSEGNSAKNIKPENYNIESNKKDFKYLYQKTDSINTKCNTSLDSELSRTNNYILYGRESNSDAIRSFDYLKNLANTLKLSNKSKITTCKYEKKEFKNFDSKETTLKEAKYIKKIETPKRRNSVYEYSSDFLSFLDNFNINNFKIEKRNNENDDCCKINKINELSLSENNSNDDKNKLMQKHKVNNHDINNRTN